jgi:Prokaryotic STING domain
MSWEDAAITSAITLGVDVVKKFFEGKKDDKDLISVGLAVGYFYNFLDVISGAIDNTRIITLYEAKDGKPGDKCQQYDSETVEVQLILPRRLDVGVYQRCEEDFKRTTKGIILLEKQKRWYGINYNTVKQGEKDGIVIKDLARPLMAVKHFYEKILGYRTNDQIDTKWLKAQLSEINAFKETLRRLQELGYGALVNRLHFLEIS